MNFVDHWACDYLTKLGLIHVMVKVAPYANGPVVTQAQMWHSHCWLVLGPEGQSLNIASDKGLLPTTQQTINHDPKMNQLIDACRTLVCKLPHLYTFAYCIYCIANIIPQRKVDGCNRRESPIDICAADDLLHICR